MTVTEFYTDRIVIERKWFRWGGCYLPARVLEVTLNDIRILWLMQ